MERFIQDLEERLQVKLKCKDGKIDLNGITFYPATAATLQHMRELGKYELYLQEVLKLAGAGVEKNELERKLGFTIEEICSGDQMDFNWE